MKRPSEELYNITSDPNELENLIESPEMRSIKMGLSGALDKWMKQQGDPGAEIDSYKELNNARQGNNFENSKSLR